MINSQVGLPLDQTLLLGSTTSSVFLLYIFILADSYLLCFEKDVKALTLISHALIRPPVIIITFMRQSWLINHVGNPTWTT